MGQIVKLNISSELSHLNTTGLKVSNNIPEDVSDYILELMANGCFLVEAAPNGLSELVHNGTLHEHNGYAVCARLISICDNIAEVEILDESKYSKVNNPVISFIYDADIYDKEIRIKDIHKAIIIPSR